ncbi:MAG: arylamine N-acetyltransferase [Rhodanobacteraceae bacterium]|nr:MAG: arylamine N-acetyltransferase [Rhodanobacteraceae bacterium]
MDAVIDLDGYFRRIGYTGSRVPTVAVLHAITRAHAEAIPFENLDVLLGHPIELAPAALYRKLVVERRGGYCFEQNGLLLEVLTRLGFLVRPLSARVRLGTADRSIDLPRTHLVLEVSVDGAAWITDVGVGSASLTAALRLVADVEQSTPHEPRRLVRADGRWYHQIWRGGAWVDVYEFTGEVMPLIDRTLANWYTSTHPQSKFRRDLLVALARRDGRRVALHGHELSFYAHTGAAEHRDVSAPGQLLAALRDEFGIELPAGTRIRWPLAA